MTKKISRRDLMKTGTAAGLAGAAGAGASSLAQATTINDITIIRIKDTLAAKNSSFLVRI